LPWLLGLKDCYKPSIHISLVSLAYLEVVEGCKGFKNQGVQNLLECQNPLVEYGVIT
jgi:hypothetical protein